MPARDWDKIHRQDKVASQGLYPPVASMPLKARKKWVRKMGLRYGPKFGAKMALKYL
jgi:hypothetical protein